MFEDECFDEGVLMEELESFTLEEVGMDYLSRDVENYLTEDWDYGN